MVLRQTLSSLLSWNKCHLEKRGEQGGRGGWKKNEGKGEQGVKGGWVGKGQRKKGLEVKERIGKEGRSGTIFKSNPSLTTFPFTVSVL